MPSNYPASLDSFVAKSDGAGNIISAAHVNDLQNAIVAIETELGTDPAGSLTDLKTRLAVMLTNAGGLKGPQQIATVAKSGGSYTTIQSAINSISDAASNKIYTVLVFPGEYNEAITLKNYVNIVAIDPKSTKILQQVTDNNVECHCYLMITIYSGSEALEYYGLRTQNTNTVVTLDGNITSWSNPGSSCEGGTQIINGDIHTTWSKAVFCSAGSQTINGNITTTEGGGAVSCSGGTQTINGNITSDSSVIYINGGTVVVNGNVICTSSGIDKTVYAHGGTIIINGDISSTATKYVINMDINGILIIKNSVIECFYNNAAGHGIDININANNTPILQNVKIVCTHADAKSIYAAGAQDVRCMSVWANRDVHANITQLITGGFNFDADVQ